jgi:BASS family bile acid:Na+ symporter
MPSKTDSFFRTYGKVLALFLAMLSGGLMPQVHELASLIRYFVMAMLFFAFLGTEFNPKSFQRSVLWVLVANTVIAFLGYGIFASSNITLALAAFMTGIAPSAISSPVLISFIKGRVEYILAAVLLTNVSSAIIIPLALPSLAGEVIPISVWSVLQSSLTVMFVPLILAKLAVRLPSGTQAVIRKGKRFSFILWLLSLFLISAKASDFLRNENTGSFTILLYIALISMGICAVNFALGAWIGGQQYSLEARQALGQKNLSFVIWIALAFINPLVAMGPTFYILYHHVVNSWVIYRFEKERIRV